ncbi:hypothetical protein HPB48_000246 [Haemaphysalis longicornis]|uniref:Uncharacterized protein n=1 Tax=Haemaphysalis longicornis TaxID=44386 RepID=A0A9J6FAM3_HAELO|nr:hypothetical protein HPB48_000246 [Haemaphysalis longicornis]
MKRMHVDICLRSCNICVFVRKDRKSKRCASCGHYLLSEDDATDFDDLVRDSYGNASAPEDEYLQLLAESQRDN